MSSTVLSPSSQAAKSVGHESKIALNAFQATVAAGSPGGLLADRAMRLRGLRARLGDCGSAGSTTVQIHINGVAVPGAEVSFANTDPDPSIKAAGVDVAVARDSAVEIVVSSAGTAAADLAVDCMLVEDFDT